MAKGGIIKKSRTPSVHSRAARRATDIDIDTDKSLKEVRPPSESVDHRPSVLAIHRDAGVSKKQKKGRNMSTKARKRHEKSMDRAAAIMERTETKVQQSKTRGRAVETRRNTWDQINKGIPQGDAKMPGDESDSESEEDAELVANTAQNAKATAPAVAQVSAELAAEMEDVDDSIE